MRKNMHWLIMITLLPALLFGYAAPVQADSGVSLQTPQNGGIIETLTPMLSWSASGDFDGYTLQIARDVNFQNILVNATNLTVVIYQVQPGILNRSSYYWRVGTTKRGKSSGWSDIWTFAISQAASGTIQVNATLDGQTWAGGLDCSVAGAGTTSACSRVPEQYTTRPAGNYSLVYNSGGPAGASLAGIVPSSTQQLSDGGVISFTLNFISARAPVSVATPGTIQIYAIHNGSPVSTNVNVSLSGQYSDTISFVPATRYNMPPGNYYLSYNYGGPSYANFNSVSPTSSQYLSQGGTIVFTLQFGSANYYHDGYYPYDDNYYGPPAMGGGGFYPPPPVVVLPPVGYPPVKPPIVVTPPPSGGYPPARPPTGGATPPSYRPPAAVPPKPPVSVQPVAPPPRPPVQATPMPSQPRPPAPSVQPVQPRPMPSGGGGGGGARPSPR
jgi:hypothetical protein